MKTELLVNKDTEREIVKMRKKGISIKEIAEQLNLSEKVVRAVAVSKKCTDKDLMEQRTKKIAKLIAEGYSKKEIMKKLKISEHQYRVSFGKLKKEDEEERLEIANKAKERFRERNSILTSDAAEPEIIVSSKTEKHRYINDNVRLSRRPETEDMFHEIEKIFKSIRSDEDNLQEIEPIKIDLDKPSNVIPENNQKSEVKKGITFPISKKEKFKERLEKFLRMMIIIIKK